MSLEFIEKILSQSPDNIVKEDVEKLIAIHGEDTVTILSELWNVNVVNNEEFLNDKERTDKDKWENIRDICSSYESEMENYMNSMKHQK